MTKGEIKYAWAFPRIIRVEKTLQDSIRARFTAEMALQTGCLVVLDLTPLLTKIDVASQALFDQGRSAAMTRTEGINLRGVFRFPVERYAEKILPSSAAEKMTASAS